MITDLDILTEFYKLLNAPDIIGADEVLGTSGQVEIEAISPIIDGGIFKAAKPIDRTKQDIVIGCLFNRPTNNNHLFSGVVNINCFCRELSNHTPDNVNLNLIAYAVIAALNITDGYGSAGLLNYFLDSIKTFRDQDDLRMYYTNIRLNYTYKTK